jgi:uncharacterized protein (TIGR03437 family)
MIFSSAIRLLAQNLPFSTPIVDLSAPVGSPSRIYLQTTSTLYRSDDQGALFTAVYSSGFNNLVTFTASSPGVLLAVNRLGLGTVDRSANAGNSWQTVPLTLRSPITAETVVTLQALLSNPATVYLRVGAFVYKSINAGSAFTFLVELPSATAPFSAASTGGGVLYTATAGTTGGGVRISTNDGVTWTAGGTMVSTRNTRPVVSASAFQFIPHPNQPDLLLGLANFSFSDSSAAGGIVSASYVFRSADQGRSWLETGSVPLGLRTSLASDGSLLIFTGSTNFVSTNFGTSFSPAPQFGSGAAFIEAANPNRIWSSSGALSTNRGESFASNVRRYRPFATLLAPIGVSLQAGTHFYRFNSFTDTDQNPIPIPDAVTGTEPSWIRGGPTGITVSAGTLTNGVYDRVVTWSSPLLAAPTLQRVVMRVVSRIQPTLRLKTRRLMGNATEIFTEGPATSSGIPCCGRGLSALSSGGLLVGTRNAVVALAPNGAVSNYAGAVGQMPSGASDEGAFRTAVRFNNISDVHVLGDSVFVTDAGENRIRQIGADGRVTTFLNFSAATPTPTVRLTSTSTVRHRPDGALYVSAARNIYRIESNGNRTAMILGDSPFTITSFTPISNSEAVFSTSTFLYRFSLLAPAAPVRIAGVFPDSTFQGDNGPAVSASFSNIQQVAFDSANGNLYVADADRLRVIYPAGNVQTVAGNGLGVQIPMEYDFPAVDGSNASEVGMAGLDKVTVAEGRIYVQGFRFVYELTADTATNPAPTIAENAVVSLAAGSRRAAPGAIFSIYGTNLAPSVASASAVPLPRTLNEVQVLVNGLAVPLFYVSPGQINAQLPSGINAGDVAVRVVKGGVASNAVSIEVADAQPDVLLYGDRRAVALLQTGSLVGPGNGAAAGEIVSIYLTGLGPTQPPVAEGSVAPNNPLSVATGNISASIGGVNAPVSFLGLAPGFIGLGQANVQIPTGLAAGDHDLVIRLRGVASNTTRITIR